MAMAISEGTAMLVLSVGIFAGPSAPVNAFLVSNLRDVSYATSLAYAKSLAHH